MEIKVISEAKNRFEFFIEGEGHAFCNYIKDELLADKHVQIASYVIDHPLVGKPHFILETDSSTQPRKALKEAVKRLKKHNEDISKGAAKFK